jgi:phytoene dehydrogenase-like protein
MSQRADVIVVGGGLAGMIAAAEAARAGAAVELCESAAEVGGRARTRDVHGFAFNQGGHALYLGGALRAALDRLEIGYTGGAPNYDRALALDGARMNLLPFTRDTIARTGLLNESERSALIDAFRAFLGRVPPQAGEAVSQYLERLESPRKVRRVLEALIRLSTYCHAPDRLDAAAVAGQIVLGFKGVLYLDGGWGGLVDGLQHRLASLGVAVRTALAAERIEPEEHGATVRFADGRSRSAAAVILAVGPGEAHRLVPSLTALRRAADLARPVRSLCLDLGLSKLPVKGRTRALALKRPLVFSVHSDAARRAPPGAALVQVMRYLGDGEGAGPGDFDELERFADRVQPGRREVEIARQRLTGIVAANDYPRADRGGLAGRAAVTEPGRPHLFLAGDWVGPEGFLGDAAAASATLAGREAAACARAGRPEAQQARRPALAPASR